MNGKFRVRIVGNGRLSEPFENNFSIDEDGVLLNFGEGAEYSHHYKVEYSSGAKDSKNREIYEGDFIKVHCSTILHEEEIGKVIGEVFYSNEYCGFEVKYEGVKETESLSNCLGANCKIVEER